MRSENNSRVIVYQVDRFAAELVAWSDVGRRIDDDEVIQDDTYDEMKQGQLSRMGGRGEGMEDERGYDQPVVRIRC